MTTLFERESAKMEIIESARALRNSHPNIPIRATAAEVATILGVTVRQVQKLIDLGEITPVNKRAKGRPLMFDFDEAYKLAYGKELG